MVKGSSKVRKPMSSKPIMLHHLWTWFFAFALQEEGYEFGPIAFLTGRNGWQYQADRIHSLHHMAKGMPLVRGQKLWTWFFAFAQEEGY